MAHLTQGIKYWVKIYEYLSFRNLCNIVHALACEISNTVFHIRETDQERIHKLGHVWSNFDTKGNGCGRQANKTTITNMQRVRGRDKEVDELVDNQVYSTCVPGLVAFSD